MRKIVLAAAMLAASTPAMAGWQWSQWGWTQEQVRRAAPEPVGTTDIEGFFDHRLRVRLAIRHHAMDLEFNAGFEFDAAGRLQEVALQLTDLARCDDLRQALLNQYGLPEPGRPDPGNFIASWRDRAHGNWVSFRIIGGLANPVFCGLTYQPLPTSDRTGL